MHHGYLYDLLIFLIAAVVTVPLFKYFKIGAILAYLFAGILIGPDVFELIEDPKTILSFSELGVVFLLFLIGLELNPSRLWSMKREVFGMGALQVLITGCLFWGIGYSLGLGYEPSFVIGFGLALSSTAFSIQMLRENQQFNTLHGQGSFSILLFQDLSVVPLLAVIPLFSDTVASESFTFKKLLIVLSVIAILVFAGRYVIRHLLRFIAESRVQEVFIATSLLVVIGTAIIMEKVGLSMGMGAFLAGILLANSEYRHELEANLQPFKGLLLGLFFIAVGMSLDLGVVASQPHIVLALLLGFMTIKALIIYILGRSFSFPKESSRNMSSTILQGGEFAFVLFSYAVASEVLSAEHSSIASAAVTLSMALTPLTFKLNQKYLRTFSEISERPYDEIKSDHPEVIIAGFGRFGQIVSRFLHTQGVKFTILEHSATQVDTARKFGSKVYYGDARRVDILEAAGAKEAKIFLLAIDEPESSIETAQLVKEHFPHLKVIARVRNRQHALSLMDLGVTNVHRETYLTSLEVAKEALLELGGVRESINKKLALFRNKDEDILKRQLEHRGDDKNMMSFTTQAMKELESILTADKEDTKQ